MIIDGRALARDLNLHTQSRINKLAVRPMLIDVIVGDDPASLSYALIKERTALKYGFAFEQLRLPQTATTAQVIQAIEQSAQRTEVCGLIVQIPLPDHIDQQAVLNAIPPSIDVDVLNQISSQKFYHSNLEEGLIPPTASAILYILDSLPEDWSQKKFLVIGRGELVGKPIAHLLAQRGYDVQIAHSQTANLAQLLAQSDVIISGVGKPNLITGQEIKQGVVIIDAGTSEIGGLISGDVEFDSCQNKAKYITPVPGGVGPLTVAKLLQNVVKVAELSTK